MVMLVAREERLRERGVRAARELWSCVAFEWTAERLGCMWTHRRYNVYRYKHYNNTGKVTALGVLCCFALFVCLTLLASFFLLSHLSFKNMYMYNTSSSL